MGRWLRRSASMEDALVLYASESGTAASLTHTLASALEKEGLSVLGCAPLDEFGRPSGDVVCDILKTCAASRNAAHERGAQNGAATSSAACANADPGAYQDTAMEESISRIDEHEQRRRAGVLVLIVATTGDGAAPANMQRFWRQIRRASLRPGGCMASLRFALLGLGDSAYPKFNAIAQRLERRLLQLGASAVIPSVFSDESAPLGHDHAFSVFLSELMSKLSTLRSEAIPGLYVKLAPRTRMLRVHVQSRSSETSAASLCSSKWTSDSANRVALFRTAGPATRRDHSCDLMHARVKSVARLSGAKMAEKADADYRDVRHIVLSFPPSCNERARRYEPGDVVYVMPRNRASAVDSFFELMGFEYERDRWMEVSVDAVVHDISDPSCRELCISEESLNVKQPCSLDAIVAAHFDLSAIPSRHFVAALAAHATNPAERERLEYFASAEGADDFIQYSVREKRSILLTLRDFPSARPNVRDLLSMMPRMKPRAFSIASSPSLDHDELHICAALVKHTTKLRRVREGVCSAFFRQLERGDLVPCWIQRGSFRLADAPPSAPLILIGPGTGIAPIRSILRELSAHSEKVTGRDVPPRDVLVYFGCRTAGTDGDYLYKDELHELVDSGVITSLRVAVSRGNNLGRKVYVQHLLTEDAPRIGALLLAQTGVRVLVAGAAGSMPREVNDALCRAILAAAPNLDRAAADRILRSLASAGRYVLDCWT